MNSVHGLASGSASARLNSDHGLASESASAQLNSDHSVASEISYIGETARPFRERVAEHLRNLANGSTKSFIIAHWMEAHESSLEPHILNGKFWSRTGMH